MISRLPGISVAAVLFLCASAASGLEPEKLVETVCTGCHSMDKITQRQATTEEWRKTVQDMVAKGAPLGPDEADAVAEYLGKKYGLSEDAKLARGKKLVESVCILCHEFARISTEQLTRDQWAGEIRGMLEEGAPLNDDEFEMVLDYLTKTYGPRSGK